MANPERGEVALTVTRVVDGQEQAVEFTLKLSMNAAVDLQTRRKKTLTQIMAEVDALDFASIRDIAFVLLQKHHKSDITTVEKAGDVVDDAGGVVPFFAAFRQLMTINQAPATPEDSEHPPTAQASTGDDSSSTPVAAA